MAYKDQVLADTPSLYWKLDEPSGTTVQDSSGNARGGTINSGNLGQPSLLPGDPSGTSLQNLNGTTANAYQPFAAGSIRTFEGWFNVTGPGSYDQLLGGDVYNACPSLDMGPGSPTNLRWWSNASSTVSWPSVLIRDVLQHVVLVYNDTTRVAELFINGVSKGTQTLSGPYTAGFGTLNAKLGYSGVGGAYPFGGRVDEFAIYEFALSPARIKAHYVAGLSNYAQIVMADSPKSFWPLDETAGTAAVDVAGSSPGTYTGGYTLGQTGPPDGSKVVQLDGTSGYVSVPHAVALAITGNGTWEAWINPTSFPYDYATVFCKGQVSAGGGEVTGPGVPYELQLLRNFGGMWFGASNGGLDGADGGTLNAWQHLVVTRSGTTITFFRNGTQVSSGTIAGTAADNGGALYLGYRNGGASDTYLVGKLAKVAIYNTVLSLGQVQAHYTAGTTLPASLRRLSMVV